MRDTITRRQLLAILGAVPALSHYPAAFAAVPPDSFSFAWLRDTAGRLSKQSWQAPPVRYAALLDRIDYDTYQKIRFRHEQALWADTKTGYPLEFFHLGRYAREPVELYTVDNGEVHAIKYEPSYFDVSDTKLADDLPRDLGFAGFRVMEKGGERDWLAFMGASYFRSSGELEQYGLSARGIAVDTALPGTTESFPHFSKFWFERPSEKGGPLRIYALLEGEALTGAYRFDCRKDSAVVMDVRAELFLRRDVERLGIAPLTSMYWYSETNHRRATDWRPEIHDSDGLAVWMGTGERIWRPLNNPPGTQTNSFLAEQLKGFGLLQRDRHFDHYQDDGVFYDRRPSVWVEPLNDWGAGKVQLVELPTDDEIHDNIVAYWVSDKPARKGSTRELDYRLHWVAEEPYPSDTLARVVATRIGRAGEPGQHEPRDPDGRKFAIDFTGGALGDLVQRYDLEVLVEASAGRVENPYALKVVGTDRWRAVFDLHIEGEEPVNLRCQLRLEKQLLTETWLYQYFPRAWGLPPT